MADGVIEVDFDEMESTMTRPRCDADDLLKEGFHFPLDLPGNVDLCTLMSGEGSGEDDAG